MRTSVNIAMMLTDCNIACRTYRTKEVIIMNQRTTEKIGSRLTGKPTITLINASIALSSGAGAVNKMAVVTARVLFID